MATKTTRQHDLKEARRYRTLKKLLESGDWSIMSEWTIPEDMTYDSGWVEASELDSLLDLARPGQKGGPFSHR